MSGPDEMNNLHDYYEEKARQNLLRYELERVQAIYEERKRERKPGITVPYMVPPAIDIPYDVCLMEQEAYGHIEANEDDWLANTTLVCTEWIGRVTKCDGTINKLSWKEPVAPKGPGTSIRYVRPAWVGRDQFILKVLVYRDRWS